MCFIYNICVLYIIYAFHIHCVVFQVALPTDLTPVTHSVLVCVFVGGIARTSVSKVYRSDKNKENRVEAFPLPVNNLRLERA